MIECKDGVQDKVPVVLVIDQSQGEVLASMPASPLLFPETSLYNPHHSINLEKKENAFEYKGLLSLV